MIRVDVRPELLRWARERAGLGVEALLHRFPRLEAWEQGEAQPTLKQLEGFAKATHTPIGYLFLPEPPVERIPIPDFRTMGNIHLDRPSPNLLEMLYVCQQRQEWYRDFARSMNEAPLPFVGSLQPGGDVAAAAAAIRHALGFDVEARARMPSWAEALRGFIEQADRAGILVMVSGVVLNNTHRPLDPNEFRGFALSDPLAPLVFINGADTKAAQMFTLAHELVHIWIGQSALSDAAPSSLPEQQSSLREQEVERWCNQVAAELLVPMAALEQAYDRCADARAEAGRLARRFKVSSLVTLRRMHDAGGLGTDQFWTAYWEELQLALAKKGNSGGDFYLNEGVRVSKRFARALVASTLEGQTLYRDALRMLGFSKLETFHNLGKQLGVAV